MVLRAEPTLVRARDTATGQLEITVDNRKGTRTRRVFLGGRDPEGHRAFRLLAAVHRRLRRRGGPGPAQDRGTAAAAPVRNRARPLTVLASSEGTADLEVAATFVQTTSAAPVDTPVILRLDPSVVRVRDTKVGQLEAIIDNRGGSRVRRVFLSGRDPERLVRFTFSPPSLDVLPGDIGRVRVRLEAPLPEPGQEATRQVTVVGSDGRREVEAERDVRADHLAGAGRDAGRAQAGAEPGPGPGQPVRSVPGDHRQPAGHPAPPGHPGRDRSRTGTGVFVLAAGCRGGPGTDRPGDRPGRRVPAGTRPGGHPTVRGLRVGRREGGGDRRHVRAVHLAAGARRADDGAARAEHRPGPEQRRRRDHGRTPTTAAAPGRGRCGSPATTRNGWCASPSPHRFSTWRPGRSARSGCRSAHPGRRAARRSPGSSPSSPPTGSGTPRRPAASSRSPVTGGRCGESC